MFENIYKHSSLNPPEADVYVDVDNSDMRIRVDNELAHGAANPALVEKVSQIRSGIENIENLSKVNREGGTGFYKLAKILLHDLQVAPDVQFGFEENLFFTKVGIPISGVTQ